MDAIKVKRKGLKVKVQKMWMKTKGDARCGDYVRMEIIGDNHAGMTAKEAKKLAIILKGYAKELPKR